MTEKDYKDLVLRAQEAVHELEEPFRSIAFKEILNDLMKGATRIHTSGDGPKRRAQSGGILEKHGVQTLRQLVNLIRPQSHPEKALTIAYFYKEVGKQQVFQRASIVDGYKEALMRLPANPSDVISENKKKGMFMDMEDKSGEMGYSITDQGINEMEKRIAKAIEEKE